MDEEIDAPAAAATSVRSWLSTSGGRFDNADVMVVAIAVLSGVVAVFAGARPTASGIDALLVFASVAVVVWAAAAAPWGLVGGVAGVAVAVSLAPASLVLAALALVLACWVGARRRDGAVEEVAMAAAVGLLANALIRSGLDGFFGLSALVGIGAGLVLLTVGLWCRRNTVRRPALAVAATMVGVVGLALAGAAWAALGARSDLTDGVRLARDAIDALKDGRYDDAADRFGDSAEAFADAEGALGGPRTALALLVPAVSQNVDGAIELSAAAADATASIETALRDVDVDSLSVVDGRIDLDAVRAVEAPLMRVDEAIGRLRSATDSVESPWLVGRFQQELDELDAEFEENQPALDNALEAVRLAPQMLGGDGVRRYLVLFTTPVEARGRAGFMGNYAVIEADDGALRVSEFGRRSELDETADRNGARCAGCSEEMLARYGRFGLGDSVDASFGNRGWTSITLPAHFPWVGETAQIMFPQSGGDPIDGVISMDPYVIAAFMQYTGPVEVSELGVTVAPDEAADFILRDQYVLSGDGDQAERIDALDTVANTVIEELFAGALPAPTDLARDLAPLISEHRLMAWTDDDDEQALLESTGVMGSLPALGDDGGFGAFVANAGHSKIDVFLDRDVAVEVVVGDDGSRRLIADVTLTNGAPDSGLPDFVIGNEYGLPTGSSWLLVSFYGPPGLQEATFDGELVELDRYGEAGWQVYETRILLESGERAVFRLVFDLPRSATGDAEPVIVEQPLSERG